MAKKEKEFVLDISKYYKAELLDESVESNVDIFSSEVLSSFRKNVYEILIKSIDMESVLNLSKDELKEQISKFVFVNAQSQRVKLSKREHKAISDSIFFDMVGLGPLEILLADEEISDIVVNAYDKVYVERHGLMKKTNVRFIDDTHVMQVAHRIAHTVGRRIDASTPLCDARLADGSRVNIVIPPIALDGVSISIRKFKQSKLSLDQLVLTGSMSQNMLNFLKVATMCATNIIVSGGTGSGKTTLLNALSQLIDPKDRIVTCEDAAELQLQQPHIVRLESRPKNIEGKGEVTIRDLVKNALRMRPDRIIIGEVRGDECIDMLQAMNTGHDGSLSTIHANTAKETLVRLENMIAMSGVKLPHEVVKAQIAGAIELIVQTARLHDGSRKIIEIAEIVGMSDDNKIICNILFKFVPEGEKNGKVYGHFESAKIRPMLTDKAVSFGLEKELFKIMGIDADTPEEEEGSEDIKLNNEVSAEDEGIESDEDSESVPDNKEKENNVAEETNGIDSLLRS